MGAESWRQLSFRCSVVSNSLQPHELTRLLCLWDSPGILEWVAISSSRGSSPPRDRAQVSCISCIGRWNFYHWAPGKPAMEAAVAAYWETDCPLIWCLGRLVSCRQLRAVGPDCGLVSCRISFLQNGRQAKTGAAQRLGLTRVLGWWYLPRSLHSC